MRICRHSLGGLPVLLGVAVASAAAQLPEKTAKNLDQAVDAYRAGRLEDVLRLLRPIIESSTPGQLEAADERLGELHELRMGVIGLGTSARAQLVVEGRGARLRPPGPVELAAALVALDQRATELLEPVKNEVNTGYPALVPDAVIDEKVPAIRQLLTQTDQAEQLLKHIEKLATRRVRAQLGGRAREIATRDHAEQRKELDDLRDQLVGRLVDFSLVALAGAVGVLGNERASFQERFAAAGRASDSLEILRAHWKRYKLWRQRSPMRLDPKVEQRWRTQEVQFRRLARSLLPKVRHYTEATRWWLRGRFGQGPLGGGMVKAIPAGLRTDRALQALTNYPLLMPQPIPVPADPVGRPRALPIARRHLEWWRFETRIYADRLEPSRVLQGSAGSTNQAQRNSRVLSRFAGPRRPRFSELIPEELRLARMVGYLEYQIALRHFERLLQMTTRAEQRALDDMVGQDDRFVIHSNLSRKYDRLDQGSSLRLARRAADPRARGPHERRGLAWVMALARVELGAMRAGHTGESRSDFRRAEYAQRTGKAQLLADYAGPFEKWPPTPLERDAFLEILLDGARQHYYESRTEYPAPTFRSLGAAPDRRAVPRTAALHLLQLERKLTVAIELVGAFGHYAARSLSPAQHTELGRWHTWLENQYGQVRLVLEPELRNEIRRTFRSSDQGQAVGLKRRQREVKKKENRR